MNQPASGLLEVNRPDLGRRSAAVPSSGWRAALLCALATALAILVSYPVLEMGVIDDWSYARTALAFADTGHIVYNGWATAMLGWQILWGALIIKSTGFSFLALRLSTLPLAAGAAYLIHQVSLRLGLNPRNAILASLTVTLSPLVLPLAASYMTDVAALFWFLASLYSCVRMGSATTTKACLLWLALAFSIGVMAGTGRQIIWLAALVLAPSAAWLQRKRRGIIPATVLLWIASLLAIAAGMHWFHQQRYSIPEKLLEGHFTFALLPHLVQQYRDLFLTLLLLSLPALAAYLVAIRTIPKRVFFCLLVIAAIFLFVRLHSHGARALAPWSPDVVSEYGVLGSGDWEGLGVKPLVLSPLVRGLVTCTVFAAACAWLATLIAFVRSKQPLLDQPGVSRLFILLGPFTAAYFGLVLSRATFGIAFDRYLIPVLPLFVIAILRLFQETVRRPTPALSFWLLGLISAYSIATTHDYFGTQRARLAAASVVHDSGVPRTEIQGGVEYDGWTQIDAAGFMADPRLEMPAGTFKVPRRLEALPKPCHMTYADWTPAINPRYFVAFSPMPCLAKSRFGPISYGTWLPPFRREIYIQQVPSNSEGAK